jgi:hypothetical protein
MTCGIYKLEFKGLDGVYIGQSINIEIRYISHKYSLKKGTGARKLQEAYNIYGAPSLSILLECTEEELNINEQEAIDIFNSVNNGLNTKEVYGDKIIRSLSGVNHPRSKYSEAQIVEVFFQILQGITQQNISIDTGVNIATIREISTGNVHKWLKELFEEEYLEMLGKKGNRSTSAAKGIVYPLVISPTGDITNISNLREFCLANSLDRRNMSRLFKKECHSVKGWKLHIV